MLETLIILTAILIGISWTLQRRLNKLAKLTKTGAINDVVLVSLVIAWYEEDAGTRFKAARMVSSILKLKPELKTQINPEHLPTLNRILQDARTDS